MDDVVFTRAALKQLAKLPVSVRQMMAARLSRFAQTGEGDVKAMQGVEAYRLRSGDYRAIFMRESGQIVVVAIGHRRDIYR